jgi:hypothetical protein
MSPVWKIEEIIGFRHIKWSTPEFQDFLTAATTNWLQSQHAIVPKPTVWIALFCRGTYNPDDGRDGKFRALGTFSSHYKAIKFVENFFATDAALHQTQGWQVYNDGQINYINWTDGKHPQYAMVYSTTIDPER